MNPSGLYLLECKLTDYENVKPMARGCTSVVANCQAMNFLNNSCNINIKHKVCYTQFCPVTILHVDYEPFLWNCFCFKHEVFWKLTSKLQNRKNKLQISVEKFNTCRMISAKKCLQYCNKWKQMQISPKQGNLSTNMHGTDYYSILRRQKMWPANIYDLLFAISYCKICYFRCIFISHSPSVLLVFTRPLMVQTELSRVFNFTSLSYSQNSWKFHARKNTIVYSITMISIQQPPPIYSSLEMQIYIHN